jgi:4a-hydroxytetrahydrobiopterin dehydratase
LSPAPRPPSGWSSVRGGRALSRVYVLRDFSAAMSFLRRIAALAESLDHHPDLHLTRYRRLRVVLTSHDAGRVTSRDLRLADGIDALPKSLFRPLRA